MAALQGIAWEECLLKPTRGPELRELEKQVREERGIVPRSLPYLSACPWVPRASVLLGQRASDLTQLDPDLSDLIGLTVAQENSCRWCYAGNRILMGLNGYPEERIRKLEQDMLDPELGPKEQLALAFVRRLCRASPLPSQGDTEELLGAGWSPEAVKEIAFVGASSVLHNRLSTIPALPPQRLERVSSGLPLKIVRLWFGRRVRTSRARTPAALPASTPQCDSYGYVVEALAGLRVAHSLAAALQLEWAPSILPGRTKALVHAVIARGLGSERAEAEAVGMLLEQGLERGQIEGILQHLGGPQLDPIEAVVVPFARETVWFEPVQIQRRARELLCDLTQEQFVDLVGVVAMANCIGRLSPLAEA